MDRRRVHDALAVHRRRELIAGVTSRAAPAGRSKIRRFGPPDRRRIEGIRSAAQPAADARGPECRGTRRLARQLPDAIRQRQRARSRTQ
jgi:hypothetical protein